MTLEELGSVGEFVGALAVLVTLIYLAVQIHQHTKTVKAQINQARSDSFQQVQLALMNSDEMLEIAGKLKGEKPWDVSRLDSLDDIEKRRLRQYLIIQRDRADNLFYQNSLGLIEKEYYESQVAFNILTFGPFWQKMLGDFGRPSFSREIDRILSD